MNAYANEINNKEFLDTIQRMALVAQYRTPNIEAHIERIRRYTYTLALGMDLSGEAALTISYASQLHDIGEAGVSQSILAKAGELSAYDWEIVKRHTTIGAEMLSGSASNLLQTAEMIALTHHERWNGSGYPKGLRGEAIPISGRLTALADVFDALTTARAYKKETLPLVKAKKLILESSNELFDHELIAVFAESFDELANIHHTYKDRTPAA
jgi:putative two-component system response regulator